MPKLYVSGLPSTVTDSRLHDFFQNYGQVADAVVMKESDSGRCKGFGFVSFASDDDAASAMNANEAEIEGSKLHVSKVSVLPRPLETGREEEEK